ncbi:hypothetical protein [Bradyrhizobium sp. 45]|uniref:hypothetical protein n=1 Tax=Bradyrhizobium sp. 45 TaxID=1043587 RepID=UPI001FF9ADBE|nr:hypothetical protein [Bradyrhizobium sp. 45]
MFDTSTSALLRAVLDDVCESDVRARTHVASRILEAATGGEMSPESLKQVGRQSLLQAPTMWR